MNNSTTSNVVPSNWHTAGAEKREDLLGLFNDDMTDPSTGDKEGTETGLKMQRKARRKKTRSRRSQRTNKDKSDASQLLGNTELGHSSYQMKQPQRKLFVGQLPSNVEEDQLRCIFEPFGKISQLTICRDRDTGESQRCCFVSFERSSSALAACKGLHNAVHLSGMIKPLQVKFAEYCSNLRQRKIFVGMISKNLVEVDLLEMFRVFGDIDDCSVIREPNGHSKGCAFVTYVDKGSAAAAIEHMHMSRVMSGCRSPVVVKLADSKAAKESKKLEKRLQWNAAISDHHNVHITPNRPTSNTSMISSQLHCDATPFILLDNASFRPAVPTTYLHSSCFHGNTPQGVSSSDLLRLSSHCYALSVGLTAPIMTAPVIQPICNQQLVYIQPTCVG